jgi:mannose-1-phosphate guanylyltransferase
VTLVDKIIPVLLCGGSGTRLGLTPPKQFQNLIGDHSMIEETAARCQGENFTDPILVTHINYKNNIEKIAINSLEILYETEQKNTGPAIAMTVNYAYLNYPNNPLLFLPCDHDIPDHDTFQDMILSTDPHRLTCFGKQPISAETNYGYIETNASGNIQKFHEKPDAKTAQNYLKNQNMFWNMGIFYALPHIFKIAFATHAPDINGQSISFDKAVMEHVTNAAMIAYHGAWKDIGF